MEKIVKPFLYESLVGVYTASAGMGSIDVEIYKNPRTLSNMKSWCRGITDLDGNLYIADNPGMIHLQIYQFLINKGALPNFKYESSWGYLDSIAWQRNAGTNKLFLSESYDVPKGSKRWEHMLEWGKNIKYTPHIKYVWENVPPNWSYFDIDKSAIKI